VISRTIALVLAAVTAFAGIDLDLTSEDVDRGLAVGRRSDAETAAFHRPYIHEIDRTVESVTVRQVEVLTPFRRVVHYAEQRRRFGDVVISRADAEKVLKPWRTKVAIVTIVRFHPQNVLTSVPPIEAAVRDPVLEANVPALEATRRAIMNAGTTRPILGATIETVFDAGLVANLKADVIVTLHGKELARTAFDFRAID
jgi:hypothetical protein